MLFLDDGNYHLGNEPLEERPGKDVERGSIDALRRWRFLV
jgi:hypothetical protein